MEKMQPRRLFDEVPELTTEQEHSEPEWTKVLKRLMSNKTKDMK